jgi:hypothetical protein
MLIRELAAGPGLRRPDGQRAVDAAFQRRAGRTITEACSR